MKDNSYNGWTNYETWNVKLWMDNDEGSYNYWREVTAQMLDHAEACNLFTAEQRAALNLADFIRETYEDGNPLGDQANCYTDLLGAALSNVNWDEIARAMIEDYEE